MWQERAAILPCLSSYILPSRVGTWANRNKRQALGRHDQRGGYAVEVAGPGDQKFYWLVDVLFGGI